MPWSGCIWTSCAGLRRQISSRKPGKCLAKMQASCAAVEKSSRKPGNCLAKMQKRFRKSGRGRKVIPKARKLPGKDAKKIWQAGSRSESHPESPENGLPKMQESRNAGSGGKMPQDPAIFIYTQMDVTPVSCGQAQACRKLQRDQACQKAEQAQACRTPQGRPGPLRSRRPGRCRASGWRWRA